MTRLKKGSMGSMRKKGVRKIGDCRPKTARRIKAEAASVKQLAPTIRNMAKVLRSIFLGPVEEALTEMRRQRQNSGLKRSKKHSWK